MFNRNKPETPLQTVINDLLADLHAREATDPEFAPIVGHVETLSKLKEINAPKPLDVNTMAVVGANLAGILMIVGHEKAHVVTSKALAFVLKLR